MIGLTPDQAQAAWKRSVELAGDTKVTHHVVQRALRELKISPGPQRLMRPKQSKADCRRLVDSAMAELMALLRQKVSHETLL